ncbi:hypothetical protein chiPu_0021016 [Chiloscyllium punctatum]|uniref:Uncharacterized protein n=1 Tax=Chiloscyllium punctatum TaxID=137246 RepID=A0A401RMG0_CHIPU|nr:hypothetical protein [Chiloscyllium punctatum]
MELRSGIGAEAPRLEFEKARAQRPPTWPPRDGLHMRRAGTDGLGPCSLSPVRMCGLLAVLSDVDRRSGERRVRCRRRRRGSVRRRRGMITGAALKEREKRHPVGEGVVSAENKFPNVDPRWEGVDEHDRGEMRDFREMVTLGIREAAPRSQDFFKAFEVRQEKR